MATLLLAHFASADEIDFARDVQPILAKRCFACHGPAERESGLAFHDRSIATGEAESGKFAILPGDPTASELIKRVTSTDESHRMPPEGKPLSTKQIETLRKWIDAGAPYAKHWSFVVPTRPEVPQVTNKDWVRNPIDNFVLARLEAAGIAPSPAADRQKLLRRISIDLVGLLPSLDAQDFNELVARIADVTGQAADVLGEDSIDRLLASKHFGERWGRHWLDLARYADSFGYERDDVRPNAWRYRDWVIQSFNNNQPFDQFVIDQLAGDLLDEPTLDQKIATGLHRMNIKNNESGINKEDYRNRETVDRVNTTGTALLGLTIGCCQCHSHKYDPLTQEDYYSFYAFFNNVEEKDVDIEGSETDRARYKAAQDTYSAKKTRLEARQKLIGEMRKFKTFGEWQASVKDVKKVAELLALFDEDVAEQQEIFWRSLEERADDLKKAIRQLSVDSRHLPKPYIMTLGEVEKDRRKTFVLERGDFKLKAKEVFATVPAALSQLAPRGDTPDRLDLARWITSPTNPLMARVAVNHIWKQLFGTGLVATPDDFGTQGDPPSHPELLDWLAVEFTESGWDRKRLIKTIVRSATYQQSARTRDDLADVDPENRLLARQSRFRVEAEIVRDLFLDASGLLHRDVGGPTVYPAAPAAIGEIAYKYKTRWITSDKPQRYRRGMYTHFKRTNPYPTLLMFDGPESNVCQAMRNRSNTPLQALAMLNDPVFVECAQALGQKLASIDAEPKWQIEYAGKRCLSRKLESREVATLMKLFEEERDWYAENPDEANAIVGEYASDGTPNAQAAALIAVARTILNLDEFVTRE